ILHRSDQPPPASLAHRRAPDLPRLSAGAAGSVKYLLFHSPTWSPDSVAAALEAEQVERRLVGALDGVRGSDRPSAYLLDPASPPLATPEALTAIRDSGTAILALGAAGETDVPTSLPAELLGGFIQSTAGPRQLLVALRAAFRVSVASGEQR